MHSYIKRAPNGSEIYTQKGIEMGTSTHAARKEERKCRAFTGGLGREQNEGRDEKRRRSK